MEWRTLTRINLYDVYGTISIGEEQASVRPRAAILRKGLIPSRGPAGSFDNDDLQAVSTRGGAFHGENHHIRHGYPSARAVTK